jgi:hypothetical protein
VSATEPDIVVQNREELWWLLFEAAQHEHMIMCEYLYAGFSLKRDADEGLTPDELAVVTQWRTTLREIAVQEMLHLALVCNVTTAIGAAPNLFRPNFPQRSGYFPPTVQLALLPFDEAGLTHFLYLERPEGMERVDAPGFVPTAPPHDAMEVSEVFPRMQDFATVGHLYRGMERGLAALVERLGEGAVFVSPRRAQCRPEELGWPDLTEVTDLASAHAAIDRIIEQGEGARGDWQNAHYGRFLQMWDEYQTLKRANPSFQPARPVIPAFAQQPFDIAEAQTIITAPLTTAVAELFAIAYEVVLQTLTRFFTHTDETEQQLTALLTVAIGTMTSVVAPLGATLTRMPVGDDHSGATCGPAFEMYYSAGNFVPWREAAWALVTERVREMARRCRLVAARPGAPEALRGIASAAADLVAVLEPHIPAAMLPRGS